MSIYFVITLFSVDVVTGQVFPLRGGKMKNSDIVRVRFVRTIPRRIFVVLEKNYKTSLCGIGVWVLVRNIVSQLSGAGVVVGCYFACSRQSLGSPSVVTPPAEISGVRQTDFSVIVCRALPTLPVPTTYAHRPIVDTFLAFPYWKRPTSEKGSEKTATNAYTNLTKNRHDIPNEI